MQNLLSLHYALFKVGLRLQMNSEIIIPVALRTIRLEAASISGLEAFINTDFQKAVEKIAYSKGRLIVSGIGKSAIIAQKIVATLNSTGTASVFMHAADAIHGDLGMIQPEDIVLLISKSGDSPEIKVLVPLLKNFGNILIGMAGNIQSYLAGHCDILLNTTVAQEACPNNLAPTSSTTAQMVMGDALAVCLMEMKGFNSEDFAKFHPGGTLGKKLYLRVSELIIHNQKPAVNPASSVKEVIVEQLGVDPERVKIEASFIDDLGADSLDIVELVMEFEKEFNIDIPDEDAEKLRTVGDAINYLDQKVAK